MTGRKKIIQYYNPHLILSSIINFFFGKNSVEKIVDYFSSYTGKKYILPTFSCRSALYLTYKALNKKGEVITSPLTCLTAILPITSSGNQPVFTDINENNLNVDPYKIGDKITDKTMAIQVIHFAGYPCEMDPIINIAKEKQLLIIEDCAQSFGAIYKGSNVGSFGEVSCFSMAKNLYGIVGGILATNNKDIYDKAKQIQETFEKPSATFLYYRLLRNYLRSKPNNKFYMFLYKKLMELKNKAKNENESSSALTNYLKRPDNKIFNLSWLQIQSLKYIHKKRLQKANVYIKKISNLFDLKTPQNNNEVERSFVKFYISGNFNSEKDIETLNDRGIEAKHLEEDFGVFYQTRFDNHTLFKDNPSLNDCNKYFSIHDSLISLPLTEDMKESDIDKILGALEEINKN